MKRTRDTMRWITLLPKDIIKCIIGFLNHDDSRSLNQTCKPLRKYILHKCVSPYTQKISYCRRDCERLKNGDPALSKRLILDEIPLDSELLNLIRDCCPKLKYLFIKYSYKCDVLMLNFENLPCVEISIKINMLDSVVENFTVYISEFLIPVEYKRTINLNMNNLENLKSL
jgi:hypothetical protein